MNSMCFPGLCIAIKGSKSPLNGGLNCSSVLWCGKEGQFLWYLSLFYSIVVFLLSVMLGQQRASDLGMNYPILPLHLWPNMNTGGDSKSCITARPNNEATQKTPAQQNWTFVSQAFEHAIISPCTLQFTVWIEGVHCGVCGSWVRWYTLSRLDGFSLQELFVKRAKGWMEVIVCKMAICLHVIWKPWINNFTVVIIL